MSKTTKHEGFATAFQRLDREILEIRKAIAISTLYAWNWETAIRREDPNMACLVRLRGLKARVARWVGDRRTLTPRGLRGLLASLLASRSQGDRRSFCLAELGACVMALVVALLA